MTANQTTGGARPAFEGLANESSKIVDDARELGKRAMSTAGHAAESLRDESAAALNAGRKKAEQFKGRFDDLVSDHPATTVLVALGVGALLGFTLGRVRQ